MIVRTFEFGVSVAHAVRRTLERLGNKHGCVVQIDPSIPPALLTGSYVATIRAHGGNEAAFVADLERFYPVTRANALPPSDPIGAYVTGVTVDADLLALALQEDRWEFLDQQCAGFLEALKKTEAYCWVQVIDKRGLVVMGFMYRAQCPA